MIRVRWTPLLGPSDRMRERICGKRSLALHATAGSLFGSILRYDGRWWPRANADRHAVGFRRRVDAKRWVECQLAKGAK